MGWSRAARSCAAVRSLLAYLCQTPTNTRTHTHTPAAAAAVQQRGDDTHWCECRERTKEKKKNMKNVCVCGGGVHVGKLVQVLSAHALARSLAFKAPLGLRFLAAGTFQGFIRTPITLLHTTTPLKDLFLEPTFSI